MKHLQPAGFALRITALLLVLLCAARLGAQTLLSDRENYFVGEDIRIDFTGGPGNTKDWIGVYQDEQIPGGPFSTIWFYVDGTRNGNSGLREGSILFPGGLSTPGIWDAFFLLNDGYDILTNITFNVIDTYLPAVRPDRRVYAPGQAITVAFTNGPANPKDWVAVYKADQTPGGPPSTLWSYVDGTRDGNTGFPDGSVAFPGGLAEAGEYRVYLLENDSYTILASEPISVIAPPPVSGPRLLSTSPSDGSTNNLPDAPYAASITDGTTAGVLAGSVSLSLDGTAVPAAINTVEGLTTIAFTNATALSSGSTHIYVLAYADTATPSVQYRVTNSFNVRTYRNIALPTPIAFESFDTTAEGEIPAGWTRVSYTEAQNSELDLGNLDSASYAQWTTVEASRFQGTLIGYSNAEAPTSDYQRVNRPNPSVVVDGRTVRTPLGTGRFVFSTSGYRNGLSQVTYLYTPEYDLTGRTNIHVAYKSLWEQNQDSIAAVEYSVDGGNNWLPVAYYLHTADIVRNEEGAIDAEATFNTESSDIARYIDDLGVEAGGTYGAFIAAPISSALAPFIEGRIDDDSVDSKRYELYPLPAAAGQSRVKLRFAHAGTDSWYWGIDDLGIYSIATAPQTPPPITFERVENGLRLSWQTGTQFALEYAPTLNGPWNPVVSVSGNPVTVAIDSDARYFRLR